MDVIEKLTKLRKEAHDNWSSGPVIDEAVEALNEIKEALYATTEFDNFECDYGPTLGTCTAKDCLHCRVARSLGIGSK